MSHFYTLKDGKIQPRHFVPLARGEGLRPTRITDARKNGWYPSVTTIQGMLDKPALNDWRVTEHLKTVFGLGTLEGFSTLDDFCQHVKTKTREALDKAPQQGTDFHDVMEKFYNGTLPENDPFYRIAVNTHYTVATKTGEEDWIPEQSFVHEMGYAGKVDLHNNLWVLDFKTKNTCDKWKPGKMHYPEMAMQLGAYRMGLGTPKARCANVFVCLEDGSTEFHEWANDELDKQFANFTDLLRVWLRNAGYVPGAE